MVSSNSTLSASAFEQARAELYAADSQFKRATEHLSEVSLKQEADGFKCLCHVVTTQQLSNQAADAIWNRLHQALDGEISATQVQRCNDERLLKCGLSRAKVRSIRALVEHLDAQPDFFEQLQSMDDVSAHESLLRLRGIGRWSANMVLMFHLGRRDVFGYGDAALMRMIRRIYGSSDEQTLEACRKRWSPHNTVACLLMWAMVD